MTPYPHAPDRPLRGVITPARRRRVNFQGPGFCPAGFSPAGFGPAGLRPSGARISGSAPIGILRNIGGSRILFSGASGWEGVLDEISPNSPKFGLCISYMGKEGGRPGLPVRQPNEQDLSGIQINLENSAGRGSYRAPPRRKDVSGRGLSEFPETHPKRPINGEGVWGIRPSRSSADRARSSRSP